MSDFLEGTFLPDRSCNEWADLLALTAEERLSPTDGAAFAEHVLSCMSCATIRDDYRLITTYTQRTSSVTPLSALPPSVLAEMQKASAIPKKVQKPSFQILRPHPELRDIAIPVQQNSRSRLFVPPFRSRGGKPGHVPHLSPVSRLCVIVGVIVVVLLVVLGLGELPNPQVPGGVQAASLSLHQFLKVPRGGATWVHTVSWSPDGKYIAVLWDDSTMQVLDASTYKEIFSQKVGGGHGLAWSPNSQFLASIGREDNTVEIWNISTHQCEIDANAPWQCVIYKQHTAQVEAIAWSPDGRYVASAGDDQTVQIWNASSAKPLYTYKDSGSAVKTIAWSHDGKRLVLGDENNHVQAWDALTGAHVISYVGHTGAITSVGWSFDGNNIISSSYDNTVRFWNVRTKAADLILPFNGPVFAAAVLSMPDSTRLALACLGGIVQIWNIADQQGKLLTTAPIANHQNVQEPLNNIFSISWAPQGEHIIAGGSGDILDFRIGG